MNELLKRFSFQGTRDVGFEDQGLVAMKVELDKKKWCVLPFWICWTQFLATAGFGHQWGCDASLRAKALKELCLKGFTLANHSYQRGCWHSHRAPLPSKTLHLPGGWTNTLPICVYLAVLEKNHYRLPGIRVGIKQLFQMKTQSRLVEVLTMQFLVLQRTLHFLCAVTPDIWENNLLSLGMSLFFLDTGLKLQNDRSAFLACCQYTTFTKPKT